MTSEQTTYSAVLGVVLAGLRQRLGVDQADMAGRMGVSQASYSRLEGGKSTFSVDQMFQAGEALGLTRDELMGQFLRTLRQLESNSVQVTPHLRANTTQARQGGSEVGHFIAGAGLAAVLIGLLGKN